MNLTSKIRHRENETYQLVPSEDGDYWSVRFLEGQFAETIIQYGAIAVDENTDDQLNFSFFIQSSPDTELTVDNVDLQLWAGDVLHEIIRDSLENQTAEFKEVE